VFLESERWPKFSLDRVSEFFIECGREDEDDAVGKFRLETLIDLLEMAAPFNNKTAVIFSSFGLAERVEQELTSKGIKCGLLTRDRSFNREIQKVKRKN
jgi:4-hydroxy-3-methylbut-2-enyl diphosphate reductase IspH